MAEIATAAGSKAVEKVTETVYDSICQKISYVFKYQNYMEKAKERVEDLKSRRQDVEAESTLLKDKGKRFTMKLGKEAEKVAEDGAKLLGKGNFAKDSHLPILRRTESIFVGEECERFDSRESNFQDIIEALKDSKVSMIGVHGMGGVGKTTLVKEVAWRAKEDNLFDEVVFTEVTQTPDLKQIQADIAGQLGMVFRDQESLYGRADQLCDRLKKAKRILVIVDNIWERIDLKAVGIPFSYDDKDSIQQYRKESNDDQVRCTILLTARTLVVLNQMKTQKYLSVEPLADDDARNLFVKIVGDLTDKRDIAAEIIKKCAGLPLAITTIANALKGKSDPVWRDALHQLKSYNPRCIPEMNNTLYSTIELSYALLNSEEAKLLLLLCALFNNRHVSFLLIFGMGLGLFQDVHTINDGRNRLKSLIDYLEDSCLLLKGNNKEKVKMHDVIHLVVASIAKEKRMFNIQDANGFKEVLVKGKYKDSIAISLPWIDIDGLPERVNFPNLELFTLHLKKHHFLQIPNHFFEGMKELRVLDLYNFHLLPLPSSFLCLTNLQTLGLVNCTLRDITMIGELRNLEILCFLNCEFEQLPERFSQLTQLKLLQLSQCPKLEVMTPNVIASLSRLEELYIYNSFERWEVEGRNNASLAELKRLSQLNTLCIHILNLQLIQQDFIPENLEKYKVHIGDAWEWSYEYETSRTLRLKCNGSLHLRYGVEILVEKAKYLYLDQLDGVKDILSELDREGFPELKHLSVQNSSEILYIVNSMACIPSNDAFPILESVFLKNLSNMEKICCGLVDAKSFSKLRIIKVEKCDRLMYLFSSSMAGNILQIQEIEVTNCKELKEIIGQENADHFDENERNCKVEFKQLHSLVLQCLQQFISFGLKVVLPRLENLKLSSINIENIWVDQPQPRIQCLKSLTVEECNGLKFMFSSFIVKSLVQLQRLVICNCKLMEAVIFDLEGLEGEDKIIDLSFPKLFYLKLVGLPKLTRFGTGNSIEFPTLNELHIESCSNLKTFFHNSFGVDTLKKEPEEVNLEKHITDINPLFNEKVAFPSLEKMILLHLDNMKLIWHNQLYGDSFSKLKEVRVEFCEKLMTIVPSNSTKGLLTFHNLETLTIKNCWNMKILFPVSIATGLLQLKKLWISSCGLGEIVAKEEVDGTPRFLFPQLTHLKLDSLPKLKHFYLELHTIEWPMLKQLFVYNCEELKVHASDGESQPALFSFEKVIPNLEQLGLNADNIASRCLDRIPARSFKKLKFLRLVKCDNESIAFWFGVLQKLNQPETLYLSAGTFQELDYQVDTSLQNLQTLGLQRCHRLKYLMPSSTTSFKNIKNLEVHNCNGLAYILACSAARTLAHLTKIKIEECKLVTEVIASEVETTEEEIVFSQLKILEFHSLASLTSFCSANYAFEFPCLEQVIVSQCPNLKIFSQGGLNTPKLKRVQLTEKINGEYLWNDDLNSTIHHMFTNMLGFHNLEHLKLSEYPRLGETVWNVQVPSGIFNNLKSLVLDVFLDTLTAIPSSVLSAFKNLETLEVRSCGSLKKVFDMDTQQNADGHTLKKTNQEALDFNNLKSLKVHNCCNLRYIFSPSIISSLAQLQEIEVKNCALIEEIITKEEEKEAHIEEIRIPQLNSIVLESLPNLTSFCSGINALECPALKAITMAKCPEIETFIFTNMKDQSDNIAPLFSEKVAFPSLEKMILLHLDNLQLIWHNQSHGDSFSKLKEVRVEFCEKLMTIVPSNSTKGLLTFHNLETLTIKNCWNMKILFPVSIATGLLQLKKLWISSCGLEEIVAKEEVDGTPRFLFPQLTHLKLDSLPNLKHFYLELHTIEWPMLKQLFVYNCEELKVHASDGESQPALFSFEKVIPNLEQLGLNADNIASRCLDRIPARSFKKLEFLVVVGFREFGYLKLGEFPTLKENIWNCKVPIDLFCNLKSLVLDGLSDSATIIPSNVLSYFKNVETIEVKSCDSLKEVFDMEEQLDYVAAKRSHHEILDFKNLRSLKVDNCNNLRYIFTASLVSSLVQLEQIEIKSCALVEEVITKKGEKDAGIDKIKIPLLKSISLESLPNLTSFYSGSNILECPPLKNIIIKDCQNIHLKDFSLHLPSLFSENVEFPTMDDLTLPSIITEWIWQSQLPATSSCFEKLTILVIDGFDHLKYFFSSSMVKSLFELKELEISNCKLIEGIIVEDEERTSTMLFPKLYQLKLRDLPKLTTFCSSTGNFVELSSLFRLWIDNCPGMKSFVSIFKWNDKTSTKKLEETNSNENLHAHMQSLFDKKVRLPCLERLQISYADELVKIWDDQVSLDSFSSLNRVLVRFCKKLVNVFPPNMLGRHQELEWLEVQNCDSVEEIFELLEKRSVLVEEIVASEEAGHRFVFSKLKGLYLQMLPNLKSLYPKIHISEWPVLGKLKVHGCNNVETLASEFLSIRETHGQSQNETPNQKPLFLVDKDAFPRLEELELCEMPRLLHLWRGNAQRNNAFQNLKTLKLSECGSLDNSWSSLVSFQNLVKWWRIHQ
ncbi:uncharacterized protein LOC116105696 [Pistacia vera]|uniref:uncharacterized protein LOC116105696 n=1 Tax=Pistacia vera TaxID=55513 RepID=UPI00126381FC|nr:uncharacterized protein LOC116105696 [Pistacia vera]